MKDSLLWVAGIVISAGLSAFFSWFFTYRYYKKSLEQQAEAARAQIGPLLQLAETASATNRQLLMQSRIEDAIQEYRRSGTPVRAIDSYADMTNDEKAELFDRVMLRVKGRKPKLNQYRSKS